MNKIEAYRLSHPKLLSEGTLREILENVGNSKSCIVLPAFGTLNKEELIEIFKRISLPMPQRKYNESRNLGKRLNNLRIIKGVKIVDYSENTDLPSTTSTQVNEKNNSSSSSDNAGKKRLKPPICYNEQISKKIRLSNSCQQEITSERDSKRKIEVSSLDMKKRQKITWP